MPVPESGVSLAQSAPQQRKTGLWLRSSACAVKEAQKLKNKIAKMFFIWNAQRILRRDDRENAVSIQFLFRPIALTGRGLTESQMMPNASMALPERP